MMTFWFLIAVAVVSAVGMGLWYWIYNRQPPWSKEAAEGAGCLFVVLLGLLVISLVLAGLRLVRIERLLP